MTNCPDRSGERRPKLRQDGVEQLRLPDGLGEIRRDAEGPTTGGIARSPAEVSIMMVMLAEVRLFLDPLDQGESVHVRHVRVGEEKGEGLSRLAGLPQLPESIRGSATQREAASAS